jgi:hypothetical protein
VNKHSKNRCRSISLQLTEDIAGTPIDDNNSPSVKDQIAYHKELEYIANRAGDFTKAEHHRKMQEIYKAVKEKVQGED